MDARGRPRELRTRQKRGSLSIFYLLLLPRSPSHRAVLINALNLLIDGIIYIYRCQAFHIFPPFFHLSFSNLRSSIFFQSFFYGIFFIFAIRQFPFNERRNANEKLFTRGRGRDGLRRLEIFLSFNIDTRLGCVHRAALIAVSLACYSTKKDATDSGI